SRGNAGEGHHQHCQQRWQGLCEAVVAFIHESSFMVLPRAPCTFEQMIAAATRPRTDSTIASIMGHVTAPEPGHQCCSTRARNDCVRLFCCAPNALAASPCSMLRPLSM